MTERTIYRDVVALNAAGIPIYTEGGPGGGISLVESYQTDLTGLRPEEAQALSMLNIPEPLVQLGVGTGTKNRPAQTLRSYSALHTRETSPGAPTDSFGCGLVVSNPKKPTPYLQIIQQAVWQDRLLHITYRGDFNVTSEQVVAPYGLVAKASVWYLIFFRDGHIRAWRVSRIVSAAILPQSFERPTNFDLAAFWQKWCADYEKDRACYIVHALVSPSLAARLPRLLRENQPDILNLPPIDLQREGWQVMTLTFENFETARTHILGFGGAIEVARAAGVAHKCGRLCPTNPDSLCFRYALKTVTFEMELTISP